MAGVIVLDASALIALHSSRDAHHSWAIDFFIESSAQNLAISALTLSEVLIQPIRQNLLEDFLADIEAIGIEILPVESTDSKSLAQVRAKTGLKMPDALVLHTAIRHNASIATTDVQLARKAREHNIGVHQPQHT